MYYELCGVLSTSFGKKMLYYYVELCFSFLCAMLIFVSCICVCNFIYIIIQVLLSMDKFKRKRKQYLPQARHEVMGYNSYHSL